MLDDPSLMDFKAQRIIWSWGYQSESFLDPKNKIYGHANRSVTDSAIVFILSAIYDSFENQPY